MTLFNVDPLFMRWLDDRRRERLMMSIALIVGAIGLGVILCIIAIRRNGLL